MSFPDARSFVRPRTPSSSRISRTSVRNSRSRPRQNSRPTGTLLTSWTLRMKATVPATVRHSEW